MNYKRWILFLITLVISSLSVYATSFEIEAIPIKEDIEIQESAEYQLKITNYHNKEQSLRIYSLDYPTWDVQTDPIINPITVSLKPGDSETLDLVVRPLDYQNILRGPHFINLKVRSKETNEAMNVPLKVVITSRDYLIQGYVPTVLPNIIVPSEVDPRDEIDISITLNNQNIINYSKLRIDIDSTKEELKDTINVELGPLEDKTFNINKKLDDLNIPEKVEVTVSVYRDEDNREIVKPVTIPIEILEYSWKEEGEIVKKFLRTEKAYRYYSNNPDYMEEVRIESSFFKALFSTTEPKAKLLKDGLKRYFIWDVTLDENNSMEIKIVESYRMLFVALILIIVLVVVYFFMRSPVVIEKHVTEITRRDGGIDKMKIILTIKNRSNKKIHAVELFEILPNLVDLEPDLCIGTMKPDKIYHHDKKGYKIKWNIESLEVGEERVLSYKIKSKLPIIGGLSLPIAMSNFICNNKSGKAHSNRVTINS